MVNAFRMIEDNKWKIIAVVIIIAAAFAVYMVLSIPDDVAIVHARIIRVEETQILAQVTNTVAVKFGIEFNSTINVSTGLCFGDQYNSQLCSIGANLELHLYRSIIRDFWRVEAIILGEQDVK